MVMVTGVYLRRRVPFGCFFFFFFRGVLLLACGLRAEMGAPCGYVLRNGKW